MGFWYLLQIGYCNKKRICLMFGDIYWIKMKSTDSAFFFSECSPYITKPSRGGHQRLRRSCWKLVEEVCNIGGLAVSHQAKKKKKWKKSLVTSSSKTPCKKALISVPDVEPLCKAQQQIRFKGGALIDQLQIGSNCRGQGSISLPLMQNSWRNTATSLPITWQKPTVNLLVKLSNSVVSQLKLH